MAAMCRSSVASVSGANCPARRADRVTSWIALSGRDDCANTLSPGINGAMSMIDVAMPGFLIIRLSVWPVYWPETNTSI